MTAQAVRPDATKTVAGAVTVKLRILLVWQAMVVLLGVLILTAAWLPVIGERTLLFRVLLTLAGLALAGFSLAAIRWIGKGFHRGRFTALAVNYLFFLGCLLGAMQVLGMFTGLDSLAATFGKGVPFLLGVAVGYLVSAFGDRYENYPLRQQRFRTIGKWIMIVFGVTFLFAVGIIPGTLAVLSRLASPVPLLLVSGVVISGIMLLILGQPAIADHFKANSSHEEMISGYLFLSPNLLGFLLFFAGPLIFSLYVSFTNSDAFGKRDFIGVDNYAKILNLTVARLDTFDQPATQAIDTTVYDELTRFRFFNSSIIIGAQDKLFWIALRNTFVFCLLAVPLAIIPALLLANILNSKLPGMKFFRAVYFLPSVAAVVGVALIWQWLYNAAVGYINYGIVSTVQLINNFFGAAIADPQVRWLSDTRTALLAVVIMSAWQWMGFNTVLFLAGLQNIPNELYEAATVDGAGRLAKFFNVTIPLLAPTTFFVVTTAIIQALQLFEQVYVLIPTEPPGGPNNSTLTLVLYLYQKGFQRFEQGYASAVAWVLFIVIFAITLLQFRRQRSGGAYAN